MSPFQPAPTARHHCRSTLPALAGVLTAFVAVVGWRALAGGSPTTAPSLARPAAQTSGERIRGDVSVTPAGEPPHRTLRALDVADGHVPDGVGVFDDAYPAVTDLDPALLGALREAATDAASDGVTFRVHSGWRSPAYQGQLLREAATRYGARADTARWVATPATSPHVSGDAVDLGGVDATAWLSEHGAKYGLCQIYANESWHYELRADSVGRDCPAMYADAAHDPRMQQ